ncbi:sulfite exporter TauE/SafE family protein [Dermacoccus nishinomiyaensis]|uniref:sulfite exporter TauE/SafE family protein n=1 Tax=Dermacoccus nishinomiyaensis TaxID=1274 RepID=UPI001EF543F0|nr:sulfite exporter TauE/SafE family protein [Dermacoccus nishinomiyaensis]MCG7428597.1 sulfite exporter TauE/SafE family protein [Dermacoccus nishinomiyaensis]
MEFTAAMLAAVVAAILVGAVLQRLSGSGMGLVLAPTLTLIMGAAHGVLLANATTTVSGLLLTLTLRRDVDWRRTGIICACVVPGALVGAVVVREVSAAWLQVVVGVAVLGAIGFTVGADRLGRLPHVTSAWPTPVAGVIGGFFNTLCGVSAPVLVIHSRLTRWEHRSFAATLQPIFMTMGAISVIAKTTLGSTGSIELPPWWLMPLVVVLVLIGVRIGEGLTPRVTTAQAKRLAMALAALGGASALVRGLLTL